jgi:hypothetical protein
MIIIWFCIGLISGFSVSYSWFWYQHYRRILKKAVNGELRKNESKIVRKNGRTNRGDELQIRNGTHQ